MSGADFISFGDRVVVTFSALTELARSRLRDRTTSLESHFRAALASACAAVRRDPAARRLLRDAPPGVAVLRVPPLKLTLWIEWRDQSLHWGQGESHRDADVEIVLRDESTAQALLRGALDTGSAVGLGDIRVRGLIPLAEGIGLVLDRVALYLPRGAR